MKIIVKEARNGRWRWSLRHGEHKLSVFGPGHATKTEAGMDASLWISRITERDRNARRELMTLLDGAEAQAKRLRATVGVMGICLALGAIAFIWVLG